MSPDRRGREGRLPSRTSSRSAWSWTRWRAAATVQARHGGADPVGHHHRRAAGSGGSAGTPLPTPAALADRGRWQSARVSGTLTPPISPPTCGTSGKSSPRHSAQSASRQPRRPHGQGWRQSGGAHGGRRRAGRLRGAAGWAAGPGDRGVTFDRFVPLATDAGYRRRTPPGRPTASDRVRSGSERHRADLHARARLADAHEDHQRGRRLLRPDSGRPTATSTTTRRRATRMRSGASARSAASRRW